MNHYWRRVGSRTLISREGRRYFAAVLAVVMGRLRQPARGPVRLHVTLHPPDARRRDMDNVLKPLIDAMENAGVYEDDSQIVELHVVKREPRPCGRVLVRVFVDGTS